MSPSRIARHDGEDLELGRAGAPVDERHRVPGERQPVAAGGDQLPDVAELVEVEHPTEPVHRFVALLSATAR